MADRRKAPLDATLLGLDRWLVGFAARLWRQVDPEAIQTGLRGLVLPALMPMVTDVQMSAVEAAATTLDGWGGDGGNLDPTAFAGYAPSGAPLTSVVIGAAITSMSLLRKGQTPAIAMSSGAAVLERDLVTVVHDTGRQAVQVGIVAEKSWTGWRRNVEAGACSRCIILAGRVYRWSESFSRHPKCRCYNLPESDQPGPWRTTENDRSPEEIFESLSKVEQDRIFTADSAQAIRDGADMGQVVNARRGMTTVSVGGVDVKATTAGTTRRGYFSQQRRRIDAENGTSTARATANKSRRGIAKPRLLPEEIYKQAAGDRDKAIRLLHSNGYYVAR